VLVEQSGLPYIRPHDLRHTYISLMIYAGADVLLIADRVGHSRPSITTDKYGHVFDAQRDAGAMPLSKLLKPKKSEEEQQKDQPEDQPETLAEDGTEDPEKAEKS
jgi:Phage integrase family